MTTLRRMIKLTIKKADLACDRDRFAPCRDRRGIGLGYSHAVVGTIAGGVAGRGKGATGGSVGDRAHPNLARATAYYRRWPTIRPCLLAFRFTAATVLLIDLAIVVTGVFLRE